MGNWRRAWILGTIPPMEIGPLRDALLVSDWRSDPDAWENRETCCLSISEGLCGLGDWPAAVVNAVGNLNERDFSPEDVREACARYVLPVAPGAQLTIHCGGDWESSKCVGTVTAGEGKAVLGPPAIPALPEIPEAQITGNYFAALTRRAGGAS